MMIDLEIIDSLIGKYQLALPLSPDVISTYFEKGASSLFNLIQYSERNIRTLTQNKGQF